jgi:uncharacterized protein DUF5709
MTEQNYDESVEDDGVLEPADSLESDDLRADVLDTGIDAGEGYRGVNRFGTTSEEERRGESFTDLLAAEEPEPADEAWTDEEAPSDEDRTWERRAGRLVAPDEGARPDDETDAVASEVGPDGGGASAEEAAVHLTDDPPFHDARS